MRYYYGLAREIDRLLPRRGIDFLFTWHLDRFDERFQGCVVILMCEDKYQVPAYAGEVRAIFKNTGTKPNPITAILKLPPAIAWRELLRRSRNQVVATRRRGFMPGSTTAPMFEIPLGYLMLDDVQFVPISQRPVDVFFAGSVESERGFTVRPRLVARRQMVAALETARRKLPDLRIDYASAGPFANPDQMMDSLEYSTRLMQAKIALCPRGNVEETFRLGEAARSGCVTVAERLPGRWYNRGTPAIQIRSWKALPSILEATLADPTRLVDLSERMRQWWDESLSEATVARFISTSLELLDNSGHELAGPESGSPAAIPSIR
jgi:hypothetical protein